MAVRSPKRRLARGRVLVVLLLLGLGVSGQVMALDVIDHGIVRSLPPVERLTEVSSTVDSIHSYVAVGPIVDSQHFIWRWFAPDGTLWREDGPVVVGSSGETYAIAPVAQQFLIAEASPPAGDWRVDIQINGMHLVTQRFRIVETTAFAEYGDAPDGQPCGYHKDPGSDAIGRFPTLFASASAQAPGTHGAHVLDTNQVALGSIRLSSRELDADDPLDSDGTPNLVNQDVDDGLAVRFLPTGQIAFDATVSRAVDAPSGTCYVNALYDRNRDGSWNVQPGFAEWILRNVRVDVAPGARQTVNIPVPLESNWVHTLSEPAWLRLAVTSEPIDETGGWDGSGRFAVGEIEDYKIGVASVEDLDQAIRQAHRLASAEAWSHARSISWQLLLAMAQVTELEIKYASATAAVAVAASAQQRAYSFAYDADAAYASATAAASAAASAFASTPCATVSAHASASVQASVSAAASAVAWANASAAAAADAHAAAIAWAESLAVAYAHAKATALSFAAAVADAYARAEAQAESAAGASAFAQARASVAGTDAGWDDAEALALAWANASAWATAQASAKTSAAVATIVAGYVEAVAQAVAEARAAVAAIAFAAAQASAFADASAHSVAIATASADAVASAGASASVSVLADCCETLAPCEPCPVCEDTPCPVCEDTPCPVVTCPACPTCDDCPACPPCNCPECQTCPPCNCPECPDCGGTDPIPDPDPDPDPDRYLTGIPNHIIDCAKNLAWSTGNEHIYEPWDRWDVNEGSPGEWCDECGGPMCVICMQTDINIYLSSDITTTELKHCAIQLDAYLMTHRDKTNALAALYWEYYFHGRHNRNRPS